MNKFLVIIFLTGIVIFACNKSNKEQSAVKESASDKKTVSRTEEELRSLKPEELFGSWVNKESEMGFTLMKDGKAASINMATLDYNSWQLIENKIILNSTSKGVSNPVTTDEIYVIRDITPVSMVLSPSNNPDTKWNYFKQ